MSEAAENTHPIAQPFRARRQQDRTAWMRLMLGGGFAVVIAQQLLGVVREELRAYRADRERTTVALVKALHEQTRAVDDLVWSLWEWKANEELRSQAIMRKLGVQAPPPVSSPRPVPAPVARQEPTPDPASGG